MFERRMTVEAQTMKCVVCRSGETRPGAATLVLERGSLTLVLKHVPAEVCENCGEEYLDETAATSALASAERAAADGVTVEIREFSAA
jgi:YgiT-type zinc finger domain-containing protein